MKRAYGTGRIYQPKGCRLWYVQYWQDGKQIRESSNSTTKAVAEALLRQRLVGRDNGEVSTLTLKQITYGQLREGLLKSYHEQGNKSLETLVSGAETVWGLKALDEFFHYEGPEKPGDSFTQITTARIRKFADQREADGISNGTINRSLALLRRMLNLAKQERLINDVPWIPMRKNPPARKGFLPREQFDKLLAALPEPLKPLVTFLYWCGVRLGEALQIEWAQVDLQAGLIRLEEDQTKSGDPRVVPLPDVLIAMLQPVEPKEGPVFCATNLRKAWPQACVAAGLGTLTKVEGRHDKQYTGLIVHDLRRSAIRNLMDAGVSESVAMKISGHKTNSVFKRYNIVNAEDVLKAMRKVEQNGHFEALLEATAAKTKVLPPARKQLAAK